MAVISVYCCINRTSLCFSLQPIDSNQLKLLIPVAACHALGHVTSNVSFAAVAVSFTHTIKGQRAFCVVFLVQERIKEGLFFVILHVSWHIILSFTQFVSALEPFFNAAASQFILGQPVPLTLWLSLAPVVIGRFSFFAGLKFYVVKMEIERQC